MQKSKQDISKQNWPLVVLAGSISMVQCSLSYKLLGFSICCLEKPQAAAELGKAQHPLNCNRKTEIKSTRILEERVRENFVEVFEINVMENVLNNAEKYLKKSKKKFWK